MKNNNLKFIMAFMVVMCSILFVSVAHGVYWSNLNSLNSSEINVTTLRASVNVFTGLNVSGNVFFTGNGIVLNVTNRSSVIDANSSWMHMAYPSACSANYAVSALGDTSTCSDDWVNEGGDVMTGNLAIPGFNISQVNVVNASALVSSVNVSALPTCDSASEGMVMYEGTNHKHVGCNSTDWNDLY